MVSEGDFMAYVLLRGGTRARVGETVSPRSILLLDGDVGRWVRFR